MNWTEEVYFSTVADWLFFFNGRFNNNINTVGYVDENSRGHCISPLLYETGWIPLQISSDNGATYNRVGSWLSGSNNVFLLE